MKKTTTLLLLTICFFSLKGQTFPDKIIVVKNTYKYQYSSDNKEKIYSSDTIVLTGKRKISKLFTELVKFDPKGQILVKFGIDTNFILNHPNELLKLYNGDEKFDWNEKQKEYIFKKLTDLKTYKSELNEYISSYTYHKPYHRFLRFRRIAICGMGMPTYRSKYIFLLYNKNDITDIFTSRKSTSGYNFPYKDRSNRVVYNYKIDKQLNKLFKTKIKIDEPLKGNDLLKYIVNKIIENNVRDLYKLAAYSYKKEISELSNDFKIISSQEVYGRGRYLWGEPTTLKITLKNKYMLPGVYLQFMDSKYGGKLYTSDSIKKDYKKIVSRVQAIPFLTNYLKRDSSARLNIYYFDNSGINKFNIEQVNQNPTEWKKQDEYLKSIVWDKKHNITGSFDDEKAIKTSEFIYCGCNYRFDSNFIKKAIFIEISSDRNPPSIWFLLPDNTLLLFHVDSYHLDDAKVLGMKLDRFGNRIQLPFACLRFDKNGNLIKKE